MKGLDDDDNQVGLDLELGTPDYNSSSHIGKLILKAIEAKLTINTEIFGNMDPFLEVEFLGKVLKTPVH